MLNDPIMMIKVIENIQDLVNNLLRYDPHSQKKIAEFAGKVLLIDIQGIDKKVYILPNSEGIVISLIQQEQVDVAIKGRPISLFGLLINNDGQSSFPNDLEVKGDIGFAQQFQSVIKNLNIDWEEIFSEYFGDTIARKLSLFFYDSRQLFQETAGSFKRNTSEYLKFETKILPDQLLINDFVNQVDQLRDDVERLKLRIERLNKLQKE